MYQNFVDKLFLKSFSQKKAIFFVCFLMILPFLVLAYFNQPSGDDYWYHVYARDLGYFEAQYYYFKEINSRYVATAIASLNMWLSYNLIFYKIFPVVLICSLVLALYNLSRTFFIENSKTDNLLFALLSFLLFISITPNISSNFYWLSGAVTYQISNILFVILLTQLINTLIYKKFIAFIYCLILVLLIGGLTEITLIATVLLLSAIMVYQWITLKKINIKTVILLLVASALVIVSMTSGGTDSRQAVISNNHDLFISIKGAFSDLRLYIIRWLPTVLLVSLILLKFINAKTIFRREKRLNINLYLTTGLVGLVMFVAFFVGYWVLGKSLPLRAVNNLSFYFVLGFIYFFILLSVKFKKNNQQFILYSKPLLLSLVFILCFELINRSNIKTAYSDLFGGSAIAYNKALNMRNKVITRSEKDTVFVQKLKNIPSTIYAGDITENAEDWRNECYSKFYRKIVIKKDNF